MSDDNDNIKHFPEIAGLSGDEIDTIIELLAGWEHKTAIVKSEFRYYYNKNISLKTVKQIRVKYAERIAKRAKALISDLKANPLIYRPARFKFAYLVYKRATAVKCRGYEKYSNDKEAEYKKKITDDPAIQLKAIELCEKMDYNAEMLEIRRSSGGVPKADDETTEEDHDVDTDVANW